MSLRFFLVILIIQVLPGLLFSQETTFFNSSAVKTVRLILNKSKFLNNSAIADCVLGLELTPSSGIEKSLTINSLLTNKNQVVKLQWIRGAIVPGSLILAGIITKLPSSNSFLNEYSIRDKVQTQFHGDQSPIDNYLQYAPLVTVFGLKAAGVKSHSDLINLCVISAKAEFLMGAIVGGLKLSIKTPGREAKKGLNAMPSGHTAQAFVSATILDMEYRETSPWISVSGYAIALTTGMYRLINDAHLISEVLVGAGIGILSTKVVYYTHRFRWGKKNNKVILPAFYKNGGGLSFTMVLN